VHSEPLFISRPNPFPVRWLARVAVVMTVVLGVPLALIWMVVNA
jgi:hypothetical protein